MAYKFGYIFFNGLGESLNLDFDYEFGDGVKFKRKIPAIDEANWREWLGLQWKDVVTSNAIIEVKAETVSPEVLDAENQKLEFECRQLWLSAMLTGPFYLDNAYFLTGSEIDNEIRIRQFFKFDRWFNPGNKFVREIKECDIALWKNNFQQIKKIYKQKGSFLRFKRGLRCFLKGCSEQQVDFRLPYFVRSLEALIVPDIGKTAKQFKKRVSKWCRTQKENKYFSDKSQELLSEIYEIRSKFEHMHDAEVLLDIQLLRSYQCEEIARNAYQAILLCDAELQQFDKDEAIKKYWNNQ